MKPVRVCAIILNFFGHEDTITCVQLLQKQRVERIHIVENSDSSTEEHSLAEALGNVPGVTIASSGKNLGFAGGVNYALRQMLPLGFDAFLILNNDTLPPADLVEKLSHGAQAAALDLAAPIIYQHPERDIIWSRGNYYNIWTGLLTQQPVALLPGNFFYLTGCCLWVNRRVFDAAGLLDDAFFMYGEDVDFCLRAVNRGFHMGIVADAVIYHKTSSSAVHNSFFYEYHMNLSHLMLSKKFFPERPVQALALGLKIFFLGLRALVRTARYCNLITARAYLKALSMLCRGATG